MRIRTLFRSLVILGVLGAAAGWYITAPKKLGAEDLAALANATPDAARGETVFWAAGCASCHADETATGDAKLILAGGQRFETAFGTFVSPNISPNASQGIGGWDLPAFARALTLGVSPDGKHYYPAFPYTAYAKMEPSDIADLWAFMQTLPTDSAASAPHELAFPFTLRRGLGLWKLRYLSDEYVMPAPATPDGERGRYIVEALAHCSECHTPRDIGGGMLEHRWMSGAPAADGKGRIPSIIAPEFTWSVEDIAYYLETGFTPDFDSAGGHMALVVENMAMLSAEDRMAVANYVAALPSEETQ